MKKFGKYAVAFFVTFLVFILSGFFSLGSFLNAGASMHYLANETVIFSFGSSVEVDSVYVQIGAIYVKNGETAQIEVETSTYTTPSTTGTDFGSKFLVSNVYAESGKNGEQFNWTAVATGQEKSNIKHLYFKATKNLQLNEIVALDKNGNVLPLKPYVGEQDNSLSLSEREKAVDAQSSFRAWESAYGNLTQEESAYMTSVQTLLLGNRYHEGSVYNAGGDYNYLASLCMLPLVALFGYSPFALRITPFIATCLALLLVYLLGKELFKSEKYAFVSALLFALGGLATSSGRMGTPQSIVLAALLGSAYFIYRFFANGISKSRPLYSGLNVLYGGLLGAFAVACDTAAVFPVLGVLVLFAFGVRRIYASEKFAREKLAATPVTLPETEETETTDPAKGLRAEYAYKKRVAFLFAALSFGVGLIVFWLLGAVLGYDAAVKTYDNPANPTLGFVALVWQGIANSFRAPLVTEFTTANVSNVFAWFLPLFPATAYVGAAGEGAYLVWNAQTNAAAQLFALAGLAVSGTVVVRDFIGKAADKRALRIRRIFFVLLGGVVCAMLAGAVKGRATAMDAELFATFYLGFIPLACYALTPEQRTDGESVAVGDILPAVAVGAVALLFVLSLPSGYGFAVPKWLANVAFGWSRIVSNGFLR